MHLLFLVRAAVPKAAKVKSEEVVCSVHVVALFRVG